MHFMYNRVVGICQDFRFLLHLGDKRAEEAERARGRKRDYEKCVGINKRMFKHFYDAGAYEK